MSQDFFSGRIGAPVIRIAPDGVTSEWIVKDYQMAKYFYELQDHGYTFKTPVIPTENVCVACEG